MGYDREPLPPDRDQPESRLSWRGVIVAVVVIAALVALSIYAFSP